MRLIIDTDAGIDDAVALLMALNYPGVTIEGITTTYGNIELQKVVDNVLTLLTALDRDIPVYRGAEAPLIAEWSSAADIHGEDGLGNWSARPPLTKSVSPLHAAQALIGLVDQSPGELTLIALGPLTNIALAAMLDPTFPQKVKTFIFMGGTTAAVGNTDMVSAEWNIYCDPEAALRVLRAFPRSTMLSWEATLAHPLTWEQYDELTSIETISGRLFKAINHFMVGLWRTKGDNYLVPDPLAMAAALQPELVTRRRDYYMTVELHGAFTRGQTVIDHAGRLGKPANVDVIEKMDTKRFYALLKRCLQESKSSKRAL